MSFLFIWNNTSYAEDLSNYFGDENVVTNSEQYVTFSSNWQNYEAIVVLCELEWGPGGMRKNMQDAYGIELVKELHRQYDLTIPVLFTSFISLKDILTTEREIILSIGHDYCRLPVALSFFNYFIRSHLYDNNLPRKLSVMELTDIKSFYCSKEGILSHELHRLNQYLNQELNPGNHDVVFMDLVQTIVNIHQLFLLDASEEKMIFEEMFPVLTKQTINTAVNHIIHLGNNLLMRYGVKRETSEAENIVESFRWKVLLLDDEINEDHELVKKMKAAGINVVCTSNVTEAKAVLAKDWATENAIMVVIADYRLYEERDGIKRHQRIQGYQFLKDIASSDHLVRLIAFSGLQRKFLLKSFNYFNVRTEVKSKIDYLSNDHTYQLFCDELIEIAEENWETIEALPVKCAGFEKYLQTAYKECRQHPEYSKIENTISLAAKECIRQIQQQVFEGIDINIGAIEHIKSPLSRSKKDPEMFLKRVQNYFIARRIGLWLHAVSKKRQYEGMSSRKIAEILTGQLYPTDAYRQILSTNLGLSLDDFPKNITIEERKWLQYDMELNIFRDISSIESSFRSIAVLFGEFIRKSAALFKSIESNKYAAFHKYKNVIYRISFERNFTPVLKTPTDTRVLYLWVEALIMDDGHTRNGLIEIVSKVRYELLNKSKEVRYLVSLFRYFNVVFGELSVRKEIELNPAGELANKSELNELNNADINLIFEQVYNVLKDDASVDRNASSDFMLLYGIGFGVKYELGKLDDINKGEFFRRVIEQYNYEFHSRFSSLSDFILSKKSRQYFDLNQVE